MSNYPLTYSGDQPDPWCNVHILDEDSDLRYVVDETGVVWTSTLTEPVAWYYHHERCECEVCEVVT